MDNILYYGDNIDILKRHIGNETVDLIYLDPPFKSNQDYNVLFAEQSGAKSAAQIKAFEDTWHWDMNAQQAYEEIVISGGNVADLMKSYRAFLGENDMMAYLSMMAPRLVELKRVLKETGSIYLHCDPTASHYLKLLMDSIFDPQNMQNEIVWSYKRYTAKSGRFQRMHDIILFYKKSKLAIFNDTREEYGAKSGKADSHYKEDVDGRWYRWQKRSGQAPYKVYLSEDGKRMGDVWEIPTINASAKERLGYPTQKPESLLERIILSSSNEGSVVLDPFCGCGTAVSVAHRLNRKWIGIDITFAATNLIKNRMKDAYNIIPKKDYSVIGEPVSLPDAAILAQQDPYQFQWWALGLVGARPEEGKKGADRGIDGKINFINLIEDRIEQIIISVKGGKVLPKDVRDLRGVVEREKAAIGVLITFNEPSDKMIAEAASAGYYRQIPVSEKKETDWAGKKYPRLQILTIKKLLSGKTIESPPLTQLSRTFKKAPKRSKQKSKQTELL